MRLTLLIPLLLLAGCLEGDGGGTGTTPTTSTPLTSTPAATPTSTTPTATPTPTPPTSTPSVQPGPVTFRSLAEGQQQGPETPQRRVFTAPSAWEEAAPSYGEASSEEVDFTRETVVAVALGQRGNGCWGIRVTSAEAQANGETFVEVTTYEPPTGMACASVVTYPFHVVALEGAGRSVTFVEANATYS